MRHKYNNGTAGADNNNNGDEGTIYIVIIQGDI